MCLVVSSYGGGVSSYRGGVSSYGGGNVHATGEGGEKTVQLVATCHQHLVHPVGLLQQLADVGRGLSAVRTR